MPIARHILASAALVTLAVSCSSVEDAEPCRRTGRNFIFEEISPELRGDACWPRSFILSDPGTPGDPSDDVLSCTILEAMVPSGDCNCAYAPDRVSVLHTCVEYGADMDAAAKTALAKSGQCTNDAGGPACSDFCTCLVKEYADPAKKSACLTEIAFNADAGWCYVDPLPPPDGHSIGDESVVADCPEDRKRKLRYQPAPGTIPLIACWAW